MYEARQNKERVSRRIEANGGRTRQKKGNRRIVIQGIKAYAIGDSLMYSNEFNTHTGNAQEYFKKAKDYIKSYKSPVVVAHHSGTNKVCGKQFPGFHAEIQLLNSFLGKPNFEMGITSPMCDGSKYPRANCQAAIKNGYNDNKTIFAKDPTGLFIFPKNTNQRIEASLLKEKNYCALCNKEIHFGNVCNVCLEKIADDFPFDFEKS